MGGGNKARVFKTDTKDMNPKALDIPTSGREITQCFSLLSIYPSELLGNTFVNNYDETQIQSELKKFL